MAPASREREHIPLKYRADIDGLRAIAVVGVVAFHAFPEWLKGGFAGVDVFFVISGFLISGIILEDIDNGIFNGATFYARRIRRIFPALILVLLASLIAGYFLLIGIEYGPLGKHVAGGAAFVSNIVLWRESGYFDNQAQTKPLLHLWSLGIEEQFYLFWPCVLLAARRRGRPVLAIIGFFAAVSFFSNISTVHSSPAEAFYSPLTRLWELMLGSALACVTMHKAWRPPVTLPRLSELGFLLILAGALFIHKDYAFPGWWALLPTLGTVLILGAGPAARFNRVVLASPLLVRIGLISYPLYLWHWPLLSFARIVLNRAPSYGLAAGLVLISVVLAEWTYALEKKIRFGMQSGGVTFMLCLLMAGTGYLGYKLYADQSVMGRTIPFYRQFGNDDADDDAYSPALRKYSAILKNEPNYILRQDRERLPLIRFAKCHLSVTVPTFKAFLSARDTCLSRESGKKNILIIGDSHAADIYLALSLTHKDIHFSQATGDLCAPTTKAGIGRGGECTELFQTALKFAQDTKPDAVILEAAWFLYGDFRALAPDIQKLQAEGQKVILVGPPLWYSTEVFKIIARRPGDSGFAAYLNTFLQPDLVYQSYRMKNFARDLGISYIDRIAYFCENGCYDLNANGELLILDHGHLTLPGAEFFGNRLLKGEVLKKILESSVPLQMP